MPFRFRLPGARPARSWLVVLCLVGLGAILATLPLVGRFLEVEDPLARADAILVLSGSFTDRPLEAYDLYRAGYAPTIVLTREAPEGGEAFLARRGIPFPDRADLARDLLLRLGVPPPSVLVIPTFNDSTADEARSFRTLIAARGWHTVIMVTSKLHTRRARMSLARYLRGLDVVIIARPSRYDRTDAVHWWRQRGDVRSVLFEVQKFLAYCLGVMA